MWVNYFTQEQQKNDLSLTLPTFPANFTFKNHKMLKERRLLQELKWQSLTCGTEEWKQGEAVQMQKGRAEERTRNTEMGRRALGPKLATGVPAKFMGSSGGQEYPSHNITSVIFKTLQSIMYKIIIFTFIFFCARDQQYSQYYFPIQGNSPLYIYSHQRNNWTHKQLAEIYISQLLLHIDVAI